MPSPAHPCPHITCSPTDAFRAWPAAVPLAASWGVYGPGEQSPANQTPRWVVLGKPTRTIQFPAPIASDWNAHRAQLRAATNALSPSTHNPTLLPGFTGGWLGILTYDQGEARTPHQPARTNTAFAPSTFLRCNDAYVFDRAEQSWWRIGSPPELQLPPQTGAHTNQRTFRVHSLRSTMGQAAYERAVQRVRDYILAGDAYQVNLAHALDGDFAGSPRELFATWAATPTPPHSAHEAAYLELDVPGSPTRQALVCASPENFLRYCPNTRRLSTNPMKGTRPAGPNAEAELRDSEKDQAELAMIVDLMRNDLGRACELASVRVDAPREVRTHASLGVVQATATISGTLEKGLTWWDVFERTFPPGSVTGAPKVRAMQIIRELEPLPRGPYCGSFITLQDSGAWSASVAIRTAIITGQPDHAGNIVGTIRAHVGAGIVADSSPRAEWEETIAKARALLRACNVDDIP